jgi:hypothetical protein
LYSRSDELVLKFATQPSQSEDVTGVAGHEAVTAQHNAIDVRAAVAVVGGEQREDSWTDNEVLHHNATRLNSISGRQKNAFVEAVDS